MFRDPWGLLTDMGADVDKYEADLRASGLQPWNPGDWKKFYDFSISGNRDTKGSLDTFGYKGHYGGGAEMGNFKAGYVLSKVYGPCWAALMCIGAEAVAPFERASYNPWTVFWFDPIGSFKQNWAGMKLLRDEMFLESLVRGLGNMVSHALMKTQPEPSGQYDSK